MASCSVAASASALPRSERASAREWEWAGLKIDGARNGAVVGTGGPITTDDSPVHGYVFTVDEARLIARETGAFLEMRFRG